VPSKLNTLYTEQLLSQRGMIPGIDSIDVKVPLFK